MHEFSAAAVKAVAARPRSVALAHMREACNVRIGICTIGPMPLGISLAKL